MDFDPTGMWRVYNDPAVCIEYDAFFGRRALPTRWHRASRIGVPGDAVGIVVVFVEEVRGRLAGQDSIVFETNDKSRVAPGDVTRENAEAIAGSNVLKGKLRSEDCKRRNARSLQSLPAFRIGGVRHPRLPRSCVREGSR